MEVYFDNSATTRPYDEVIDEMARAMKNFYGNPSSLHSIAWYGFEKRYSLLRFSVQTLRYNSP